MRDKKPQKSIRVIDLPATYILVNADADPIEAKNRWLALHRRKSPLNEEQVRRERESIRKGKTEQRRHFK